MWIRTGTIVVGFALAVTACGSSAPHYVSPPAPVATVPATDQDIAVIRGATAGTLTAADYAKIASVIRSACSDTTANRNMLLALDEQSAPQNATQLRLYFAAMCPDKPLS